MTKIKLFYSYTHTDEDHREELEKRLSTLRREGKIDEWHDRKIRAGSDIDKEIDCNMKSAHIILLLLSSDFIDSDECHKEIEKAFRLKEEKSIEIIPIIVKPCLWEDVNNGKLGKLLALPRDGKAVTKWDNKDCAWLNVYKELKKVIEEVEKEIKPTIKNDFKEKELLYNPITQDPLDKLFIYPDLSDLENDNALKSEKDEVSSKKLSDLNTFGSSFVLIDGEEQSGKTSLCNMLFLNYLNSGFYPILIKGNEITGNGNIQKITDSNYKYQYGSNNNYSDISKEKRILFIDDIDEHKLKDKHFDTFILSVQNHFDKAIIFIDKLSELCNKLSKHNYFSYLKHFSIRPVGHEKRDELIKKCISLDEGTEFNIDNEEQGERLDRNTKHINTIIGTNVVPSYPVFIITIFHAFESAAPQNLSQTSYGHCYHAMITMQLCKSGMESDDVNSYFNFLTELAYLMFDKKIKTISENELKAFIATYREKFLASQNFIKKLTEVNILKMKEGTCSFGYIYIYYYFVAKYIAEKIVKDDVIKQKFQSLMSDIHKKDNANIIIFVTHHIKDTDVLESIILSAMEVFDKFPVATLSDDEKNFIEEINKMLGLHQLPPTKHDPDKERNKILRMKDDIEPIVNKHREQQEDNEDKLLIEIRKAAKSIEIIGQILKNQYGSLEKDMLKNLFVEGQNVGLRLLKRFMVIMLQEKDKLEEIVKSNLEKTYKKEKNLTSEQINHESKKIVNMFSYFVVFGLLHKIVNSLGYSKLIEVADEVNSENKTVASQLINLYIHTWYTKKLDLQKIKSLYGDFKRDKNDQAIYILKDIVFHYIYMHPVKFSDKQKIKELLGFSVQHQVSIQHKNLSKV